MKGDIENVGGILKITVIRVHYTLKISHEEESDARWAMDHYIEKCPAAMSVTGCIRLEHSLELVSG